MTSPPNPALTEAEQAAFLQSIARVRSAAGRAALDGTASHPVSALLRWYRGDDGALAPRSTPP